MRKATQFTNSDWTKLENNWRMWWKEELDRPLVVIEINDLTFEHSDFDDFVTQFALDNSVEEILDYLTPYLNSRLYFGDAFPKYWLNFGAGVMAAFMGSPVDHSTGTTWFHPLPDLENLEKLEIEYQPDNSWWRRVLDVGRGAANRWGEKVVIGTTDLGGNLDILASLRGTEQLLIDLIERPLEVDRLVKQISQVWLWYYEKLYAITQPLGFGNACWAPLWFPTCGYMLQSDFSYMISPQMFERFVMPDLEFLTEKLDYPFYHMDGKGQIPHLDMLLSLPKLRGIQWQPGDGAPFADQWLPLLKRIRNAGKLVQVYVSGEGALRIQRELGGKGFVFQIIDDLTFDEAENLLDQLSVKN